MRFHLINFFGAFILDCLFRSGKKKKNNIPEVKHCLQTVQLSDTGVVDPVTPMIIIFLLLVCFRDDCGKRDDVSNQHKDKFSRLMRSLVSLTGCTTP